MADAQIADAIRAFVGERGGDLATMHPAETAAEAIGAAANRHDIGPAESKCAGSWEDNVTIIERI